MTNLLVDIADKPLYKFVMSREALEKAIEKAGGQVPLAKGIGRTQQHISWALRNPRGKISAEDAIRIETFLSKQVKRSDLRPDIYTPDGDLVSSFAGGTIPANTAQSKAIQR